MGMNNNELTSMDGRLWMNVGGRNWMEVRWKSDERRTEVIKRTLDESHQTDVIKRTKVERTNDDTTTMVLKNTYELHSNGERSTVDHSRARK
jgi:hypothetical protein